MSKTLMLEREGVLEQIRSMAADQQFGVAYLEDRKVIVTDRETARKIAPESVQA